MMNRTSKIVLTTSAMFLALVVGRHDSALAAMPTSNITVTATVAKSCTIADGSIAFGAYDPLSGAVVDQTGTLSFTCTKTVPVTVDLGLGGKPSGALRGMLTTGSTVPLTYQIYSENTRTTVWGTGTGSNFASTGTGSAVTLTMYGRIQASQTTVVPGSYTDTVVATLNF